MTTIRPLDRADVPAVVDLLGRHLEAFALDRAFLESTLLDHPWADPELPSLVAVDEDSGGVVVGFIGAQVRRMRLDDRVLRAVCCSHLVVAPASRNGAEGALLLKRLMAGPQDLSWSDTANPVVTRMWRLFGGHCDYMRGCDWMLVLQRSRWATRAVPSLLLRRDVRQALFPVGSFPLHAADPRSAHGAFPPTESGVASEAASSSSIAEHAPRFADRGSIRPDYDPAYLEHVFELVQRTMGGVTRRLVRRGDRPIGWYAYADRDGGAGRVLHLAAREVDIDAVMGELVEQARRRGRTVLSGRLEPHMENSLHRRRAALGIARRPVIHTRDERIRTLLGSGSALITQLDGEWFVD